MLIEGAGAIVTGGASGLGRATAERLAREGASVFILDLPGSAGEELGGQLGGAIKFLPADVTSADAVSDALASAAEFAPIRILVNCAGISRPARVLGRKGPHSLDDFIRTLTVNLVGTFNVLRLAVPHMVSQELVGEERGVVINTASVAAFDGQVGQAAYSASKAGIVGMTLPIARELASHQIRVNAIAPGLFRTMIFEGTSDEVVHSLEQRVPHPARLGDPSEFASLVEHIIVNPMMNGETIRLDGALRMAAT